MLKLSLKFMTLGRSSSRRSLDIAAGTQQPGVLLLSESVAAFGFSAHCVNESLNFTAVIRFQAGPTETSEK